MHAVFVKEPALVVKPVGELVADDGAERAEVAGHGSGGKITESQRKFKRTCEAAANLCALKKGGCKMALGMNIALVSRL